MVRSDLFAAIDTRLRYLGNHNRIFGGKQIIATGDFFQLPPFAVTEAENIYLETVFGGLYAFQTGIWKNSDFKTLFLKTLHRQSSDPLYARILARIRQNDGTVDINLPDCDEAMSALEALNTASVRPRQDRALALCTTKNDAYAINIRRAAAIAAPVRRFSAKISGEFAPALYPTAECLELKVGERVMTLANKYEGDLVYCNGDMGTITDIGDETVTVAFDKGVTTEIKPFVWSHFEYELVERDGKTKILQREVGRFTQIPLRLAYATTIHKSQGLSLDSAHIVLGNGCFAPGQLYTALSRVRTLSGLSLDREIKAEDLFFAPEVVAFYNEICPENAGKTVAVDVPAAYVEQVRAFLAELTARDKIPA